MFGKTNGGSGGGMPAGLSMMLKSFLPGLDLEALTKKAEQVLQNGSETVDDFKSRLDRLEANQQNIIAIQAGHSHMLVAIMRALTVEIGGGERVAQIAAPALEQAQAKG